MVVSPSLLHTKTSITLKFKANSWKQPWNVIQNSKSLHQSGNMYICTSMDHEFHGLIYAPPEDSR